MSGWAWPLTTLRVTDEFGWRIHPIYNDRRLHRGIDLAAYPNQPVYAASAGTVTWAGYNGGEGNSAHIRHGDGSKTKYFHNTSLRVSAGDRVVQGELAALAGTTGASTGTHVHFETHLDADADSPVDPRGFMAARGAPLAGGNAVPASDTDIPEDDMYTDLDRYRDNIVLGAVGRVELSAYTINQKLDALLGKADLILWATTDEKGGLRQMVGNLTALVEKAQKNGGLLTRAETVDLGELVAAIPTDVIGAAATPAPEAIEAAAREKLATKPSILAEKAALAEVGISVTV
jgi:hypothetical protein